MKLKYNLNRFLSLFRLVLIIICWIPNNFVIETSCDVAHFRPLVEKLTRVGHRGSDELFAYIKKLRTSLLLFLSEEFPSKRIEGVSLTRDGIPKALGPLVPIVRKGLPGDIRLILTLLYSTRALSLGDTPDISTITDPVKGEGHDCKYMKDFWTYLGYKHLGLNLGSVRFKNYHWTTKSGPIKGHSLYNSMNDFYNLTGDDLFHIGRMGGKKLTNHLEVLKYNQEYLKGLFPHKSDITRKVIYFPDKEDKVRVVAMADYFSQTALKPLHKYLNKVLTKIPQDCTFDQGSFKRKIEGWTEFYSIDLTAFTDRFPIQFISILLRERFPHEYVDSWEHIMVSKPFYFQSSESRWISYSVGTPMGLYSSWPSTTLAHHYVMFHCCKELNIPFCEAKYVMLGDDILIGDHHLARAYKESISLLGVDFSPLKTHESKTLLEFSKRLLYKGEEITPFPISSIKNSISRYYRMVNLLIELEDRGWRTINGIPRAISDLHKVYHQKYSRRSSLVRKKLMSTIEDSSYISELIMRMIRNELTANRALSLLWYKFRSTNFPIREDFMSVYDSNGVFSSLAVESFELSQRNYLNDKHPPLGLLAENLVIMITSRDESDSIWPLSMNMECIPIIYAHGYISEVYMNIQRESYRIDTVGRGEWPLFLRTIAMPLDDRVYFERNNSFISRAAATLGKEITERINLFSGVSKDSGLPDLPDTLDYTLS